MADWDPFADPADAVPTDVFPSLPQDVSAAPAALTEEKEVAFHDLGIMTMQTLPDERVPCAVLLNGGDPSKMFGSCTMDHPLLTAIANALLAKRLPYLRFDYAGSGRSLALGKGPVDMQRDVHQIVQLLLSTQCDELVILGYSAGSNVTFFAMGEGLNNVRAMCSISTGHEVWRWLSANLKGDNPAAQEVLRWLSANLKGDDPEEQKAKLKERFYTAHSLCNVSVKYILGSKDIMTPEQSLRELIAQRSDKGVGVEVQIVEGADHPFTGHESDVADAAAKWIAGLM